MKRCTKMYENKYKNPEPLGSAELNNFLQLIAGLDESLELFAIGGTAMVLKNVKEATKDIDFLTTATKETIKNLFTLAGLKEKNNSKICNSWYFNDIRIDIFYEEFILGYPLPEDWKDISEYIKTIGKIRLYIL